MTEHVRTRRFAGIGTMALVACALIAGTADPLSAEIEAARRREEEEARRRADEAAKARAPNPVEAPLETVEQRDARLARWAEWHLREVERRAAEEKARREHREATAYPFRGEQRAKEARRAERETKRIQGLFLHELKMKFRAHDRAGMLALLDAPVATVAAMRARLKECSASYEALGFVEPVADLYAFRARRDAFNSHLDTCAQCREHPFGLCATGDRLIREAAR